MNDNMDYREADRLATEAVEMEQEMIHALVPIIKGRDVRVTLAAILGLSGAIARAAQMDTGQYRLALDSMADLIDGGPNG